MPLQLPNLDDRTYADLVEEALILIPANAPGWTNYNPSDPGITLVELFAYLTDLLVYRVNRVTDDSTRTFLRLLNGPDWGDATNADLREEVRRAVIGVRERYRAVTADDYEFLALVSFNQWLRASSPGLALVGRAHCVPQRNLEAGTEPDREKLQPEHVSVVIVPTTPATGLSPIPQPASELLTALFDFLDERRMLTTKLHVIGPFYARIAAQLVIARTEDASDADIATAIDVALAAFLNPLASSNGGGWPFGRDVFVSELYDLLRDVPGVDFITDVMLTSACPAGDPNCVVAQPIWHPEGNLIGLRLQQHHLPVFDRTTLVIAANDAFQSVNLALTVTLAPGADPSLVQRAVQSTLRFTLNPGLGGPGPDATQPAIIFLSDLQVAIAKIAGITGSPLLVAECVPASMLQQDKDRGPFLHVNAGKVLDWRLQHWGVQT